jgi:hypothetical protein
MASKLLKRDLGMLTGRDTTSIEKKIFKETNAASAMDKSKLKPENVDFEFPC